MNTKKTRLALFAISCLLFCTAQSSDDAVIQEILGLLNQVINKLPCDLTSSIHEGDQPVIITTSGHYCVADDLSAPIIITANNVDLNLNGHTLDLASQGSFGVQVTGMNVRIYNGIIQNLVPVTGIGVQVLAGSCKVRLEDIMTFNCPTGIAVADAVNCYIKNCHCEGGLYGITCSSVKTNSFDYLIRNTTLLNNSSAGIYLLGTGQNLLSEVQIQDCRIINTTLNASTTAPTYGIQVNQIQGLMVENSIIDATTYGISLTNSIGIRISGGTILNSGQHGLQAFVTSCDCPQVIEAITLDGITIDYAGANAINCVSANNVKIKDCQLSNAQRSALYVSASNNVSVEKSLLSNVMGSSAPIVVLGDNTNIVNSLRLIDCTIQNWAGGPGLNGINISNTNDALIERCFISTANGNGILATGDVSNCVVSNCTVSNNAQTAIYYTNSTSSGSCLTIDQCHLLGASNSGICVDNAQNCIIKNCDISNTQTGISLASASFVTVMHNIISGCSTYGISIDGNSLSCGVRDNAFINITNPVNSNGIGVNNEASDAAIYHNYVYASDIPYKNVGLVVDPALNIGAHENLQTLNT